MNQYLGWIPPNAQKVLEFGCGNGELGRIFKEIQPNCYYVGVDFDEEKVEKAAGVLDLVLNANETSKIVETIDELSPWDCVIYRNEKYFSLSPMDVPVSETGQVLIHNDDKYYNFPWRIAKRKMNDSLQIVSLFNDPVCAFMRMIIPNSFYKTNPHVNVTEMNLNSLWEENKLFYSSPYIVLFQRVLSKSIDSAVKLYNRMSSYGALLIHEFDDWPERWGAEYRGTQYMDFIGCHVIQTTTPSLAEFFRQYNPYVLSFPNELCNLPPRRNMEERNEYINIFFGAVNREHDWQEIMPILSEAIVRYGEKIHFLVVADKEFYDRLPTLHKKFIGEEFNAGRFVPYEIYEDTLHQSDIALLPLRDTQFNRMKSDLKYIEAAGHGASVLASNVVYEKTIRDGETGLIYYSINEFRRYLFQLIENHELRCKLAENAYKYVKYNRLMCQHYEERLEIYKELLNKREELERQRQYRLNGTGLVR